LLRQAPLEGGFEVVQFALQRREGSLAAWTAKIRVGLPVLGERQVEGCVLATNGVQFA
jgi:hypothetical protein